MRIEWTKRAIRDLAALQGYIADRNAAAEKVTVTQIRDSVQRLTTFPASGRPGKKPNTRVVVVSGPPFLVVYRVSDDEVQILGVIHGARRRGP